jgi:hypothetical protein
VTTSWLSVDLEMRSHVTVWREDEREDGTDH